jgi:hypothetical protein
MGRMHVDELGAVGEIRAQTLKRAMTRPTDRSVEVSCMHGSQRRACRAMRQSAEGEDTGGGEESGDGVVGRKSRHEVIGRV